MGKSALRGWYYNSATSKWEFAVYNSSGVVKTIFNEDGAIGSAGGGLTTAVTSGTTLVANKLEPTASAATASINYHKLLAVGDVTGTTAYGFGDVTKPTVGIMGSFGRTAIATGTQVDTGLDIRVINKLNNSGVNAIQGAYIKVKNYSTGTVGSMIGLFVEVASEGTVTNGAIGIKIGADGTVLEQDIVFSNGLGFVALTTAITATSTDCTLPAGTIGITSNGTGVGKLFVSNGSKWVYMAVA